MTDKTKKCIFFLFLALSGWGYAQDRDLRSIVDDKVARMTRELHLTDVQAAYVRPVIKEYTQKRDELAQSVQGQGIIDHVSVKDTMRALKQKEYQGLAGILSQDQMERWVQKENLRVSLNQGEGTSQAEDDTALTASGANFKF